VKTMAIAIASALLASTLYSFSPSGWCGSCPRRKLTIGTFDCRFGVVEWHRVPGENYRTWICFGPAHLTVPLPAAVIVGSGVGSLALLIGFGPSGTRKRRPETT
jgi:hypothetical protein